jgi:phage terminase small subunit
MNNKKTVIHVGLPKTATTFLQLNVFPFIENAFYRGPDPDANDIEILKPFIHINVYFPHSAFKNTESIKNYKKELYEYIQRENILDRNCLFSFESLVGSNFHSFNNQDENIKTMKEIFPEGKILFVFRKQDEWIESQYNQTFKQSGRFDAGELHVAYHNLNDYIGYKFGKFGKSKYINVNALNWYEMIKKYQDNFGFDNVLALPYELFRENPEKFLKIFYDFFEFTPYYPDSYSAVNRSIKRYNFTYYPALNIYHRFLDNLPADFQRFLRKNDRGWVKFLSSIKKYKDIKNQKLTKKQRELIFEIHSKNNKKLAQLTGFDLSNYGYY